MCASRLAGALTSATTMQGQQSNFPEMTLYRRGSGSFNAEDFRGSWTQASYVLEIDGKKFGRWVFARPEPYRSLWTRLLQAWDVLTYKADALYWQDESRKSEGQRVVGE